MNRPEWMPSDKELQTAYCGDFNDTFQPQTKKLLRRTGLRAQIAAYQLAITDAGDPMPDDIYEWMDAEIAALRKELEQ